MEKKKIAFPTAVWLLLLFLSIANITTNCDILSHGKTIKIFKFKSGQNVGRDYISDEGVVKKR